MVAKQENVMRRGLLSDIPIFSAFASCNRGSVSAEKMLILILSILREAQPKLGHAEPMGLGFERRCCPRQSQVAFGAGSELVGKVHTHYHYIEKR